MDQRLTEENMYMSNSAGDNQYFETADIATPDLTTSGDNVHSMDLDPAEEERKKEELRTELKKIEDDINVLREVLDGKVRRSQTIKRELGITPLNQVKHDLTEGMKHLKESNAYQKTSETITAVNEKITHSEVYKKTNETFEYVDKSVRDSAAYQRTNVVLRSASEKTSSAVSAVGASMSRKLGDLRNSNKFRSLEEKMGSAYSSVKSKVVGSKSEDNFEDVLNSTAAANGGSEPQTEQPLPEEKVPL